MNTLRRCHSMPLDFQKRDERRSRHFPSSSTGQGQRVESVPLVCHRPADLRIGQFLATETSLKLLEPISPLLLSSQQLAIDLDTNKSSSTKRGLPDNSGQKAIYGLSNSSIKGEFPINGGLQGQLPRRARLLHNDFSHPNLPGNIPEAIQMVIRAQQKVSGMRVQLIEMRSDLDERRTAQIFQWADHLKRIKSMLGSLPLDETSTTSVAIQLQLLESINQHSDDYLLCENEYRNFQRQLEAEESSLQQKQAHIAEILQSFAQRNYAAESNMDFRDRDAYRESQDMWPMTEDDSDTADSIEPPMGLHPLVEKYLNEIGEVRMYQERLEELSLEHAEITGREASFALVKMSLDEGSQHFLDNYESQRLELEQIISEKFDAAATIRDACEKEGLSLPADPQVKVETELDMEIREALPQDRDILWLSELDEKHIFSEMAQARDLSMYNFINRWIFHQLRHSTSQIHRYKSNPRLQDLNLDEDDLSEWAIKLWFQDEDLRMAYRLPTQMGSSK